MLELIKDNPWLVVIGAAAGVIVGCTAIVFVTDYLKQTHQAEIDATLSEMIARGMSAAEIKQILEASSNGEAVRLALGQAGGVRMGLGKFNVECGSFKEPAKGQA